MFNVNTVLVIAEKDRVSVFS